MTPEERDRLTRLETSVAQIETDLERLLSDVREVRDVVISGRGSWRTVAALLGLAGAIIVSLVTAGALRLFGLK